MKKVLLIYALVLANLGFSQTQTSENSTEELVKVINNLLNKKPAFESITPTYKEVINTIEIVNSSSKARFGGGKTRVAIPLNLPIGTTTWFYRVTVMEVNQNFTYTTFNKFENQLKRNGPFTVQNNTSYGVDLYVIDDFSVMNFQETGNDNFKVYDTYTKLNSNGWFNSSTLIKPNLWIGIKNPNVTQGLKVIVEVVAYGTF